MGSSESGSNSKPEEFAHLTLFNIEFGKEILVRKNLQNIALKVEKKGNHFRYLFSTRATESFAFKEALSRDFSISPKYIGIFAIQGFSETKDYIPVYFDSFAYTSIPCN